MKLKKINLALVILLALLASLALTTTLLYLRIFPLHDPFSFIPNDVICYVHFSNLNDKMKHAQLSVPLNQLTKLPIWKTLGMSNVDSMVNSPIEYNMLMRLVDDEAIIAISAGEDKTDYLIVVPVKMGLRILYSIPIINRMLQAQHQASHDNYKATKINKLELPQSNLHYAMVGRIGLISENDLPIKRAIDAYKGTIDCIKTDPRLEDLSSSLSPANISFYLNLSHINNLLANRTQETKTSGSDPSPINDRIAVGKLFLMNGSLHIETCFDSLPSLPIIRMKKEDNTTLPLTEDTVLVLMHKQIDPNIIINYLERYKSSLTSLIVKKLRHITSNFIGEAFIRYDNPKVQMIPPVLFFIKVKDKDIAYNVLRDMEREIKQLYPSTDVNELMLRNVRIGFIDSVPGVLIPISLGYSILDNGLLVVSNSLTLLGSVIDIALGNRGSNFDELILIKDFTSISDMSVSAKPREVLPILDRLVMLYVFERRVQGKPFNIAFIKAILNSFSAFERWDLLNIYYKCNGKRSILKVLLR